MIEKFKPNSQSGILLIIVLVSNLLILLIISVLPNLTLSVESGLLVILFPLVLALTLLYWGLESRIKKSKKTNQHKEVKRNLRSLATGVIAGLIVLFSDRIVSTTELDVLTPGYWLIRLTETTFIIALVAVCVILVSDLSIEI